MKICVVNQLLAWEHRQDTGAWGHPIGKKENGAKPGSCWDLGVFLQKNRVRGKWSKWNHGPLHNFLPWRLSQGGSNLGFCTT